MHKFYKLEMMLLITLIAACQSACSQASNLDGYDMQSHSDETSQSTLAELSSAQVRSLFAEIHQFLHQRGGVLVRRERERLPLLRDELTEAFNATLAQADTEIATLNRLDERNTSLNALLSGLRDTGHASTQLPSSLLNDPMFRGMTAVSDMTAIRDQVSLLQILLNPQSIIAELTDEFLLAPAVLEMATSFRNRLNPSVVPGRRSPDPAAKTRSVFQAIVSHTEMYIGVSLPSFQEQLSHLLYMTVAFREAIQAVARGDQHVNVLLLKRGRKEYATSQLELEPLINALVEASNDARQAMKEAFSRHYRSWAHKAFPDVPNDTVEKQLKVFLEEYEKTSPWKPDDLRRLLQKSES